ncbi:MAG TPA: hypothetical protein VFH50_02270 [Acidimicrobiales bacterium]|nr:hypothetical protein [Acidimicrobiales bacterium]
MRPLLGAGLTAVLGVGVAACSGANQSGDLQVPGVVSGVVTGRPPCVPGRACSFLVALVPDALVQAVGKDGSHWVRADAHGHYQLALLDGTWTLTARRTLNSASGPSVRVQVSPGGSATVDLQIALG